jgi:hypothetical protein
VTGGLKKSVFWIVMIAMTWLAIEAAALIAYRVRHHTWFSFSRASREVSSSAISGRSDSSVAGLQDLHFGDFVEAVHPYFGFVADPQQNKPEWKISDMGFPFSDQPIASARKGPNRVVIGIFGGSFTQWVYQSLKPMLETRGRETGKEFVLINFAVGGHKQPQQLMILNYLLATGAEFDVVINLDGFNEAALPPSENTPNNVNPFYPRGWDRRTANAVSAPKLRLIGLREQTKRNKGDLAQFFRSRRLYLSPTLFLIWQARDRFLGRTIYSLDQQILPGGPQSLSYAQRGPSYDVSDTAQLYRDLAAVWKRSSLQTRNLCEANGIRYYHFLQPNQYLPGSKPINSEEALKAVSPASPYKEPIEKGYPEFVKGIAELQAQGVKAIDLTQIYSDHPESLYTDTCCHTSTQGSDIVARRILELVFP